MTQLTPRDDVRKAASEILKRVDHLIRAGEIDNSMREIIRAKEIDPSNVYVRAYEERLSFLKEQHEKNVEQEKTRKEAERAARERDEERRRQQEEQTKRAEEQDRLALERKQALDRLAAERERSQGEEGKRTDVSPADGSTSETIYIKTLRNVWSGGSIVPQRAATLEQLGKDLGISPERQRQLEKEFRAEAREQPARDTILVIDDDDTMLSLIAQMLTFNGFQVTALTTSDEAYTLLKKWKPGLILCDVNLETSTMGGFSFYEKIRELDHLRDVPFVFLTGLSDEVIVRTGKELGADDYLTKPISEQNLVSTIKGKIKRFNNLKGRC